MGWESLPQDLLIKIYEKLPIEDLAVGSPLTCRHWYAASFDPGLYRVLDLRSWWKIHGRIKKRVNLGELLDVVVPRGGGRVERIRFPDYHMRDSDYISVVDRCPDIKFFYSRRLPKKAFSYAISKWKDLESMDIDESSLSRNILDEIHSNCKNFVSLRVVGDISAHVALEIICYLPKLKSIDLSYTQVSDDTLLDILKSCKELEYLDITGCGKFEDAKELQNFAAGLESFPKKIVYVCDGCGDKDCVAFSCLPKQQ